MFEHILIATDGSEVAAKAVSAGLELAKNLAARVVVMTASEPWYALVNAETIAIHFPADEYERATKEEAARILGEVRAQALTLGIECETCTSPIFLQRRSSTRQRPMPATSL